VENVTDFGMLEVPVISATSGALVIFFYLRALAYGQDLLRGKSWYRDQEAFGPRPPRRGLTLIAVRGK
jgi:hypothetical protein